MVNNAVRTFRSGIARRLESRHTFWIPVLLFAAFLPLRVPFRARFLINWDAVNFALGTHLFSLQHHQPHPPGYIGYVAAGWLLNHVTGDANTSLTLVSIISGAAAPAGFFLLASLFMRRGYALASAILFGLSPIVWYYSGVALTYSVELALALFFLWAGYLGRQQKSMHHMMVATVLLAILGAMRPSGALFLMPLWLYMVWALPWRQRLSTTAVLVAGNLAWLVPLMWLSGGVDAFLQASVALVSLVVVPTSVFASGVAGPDQGQNIAFVLAGILIGVNFGLLLIAAGLVARIRAFGVFLQHGPFFLLWLTPALLTYLLLHTGQLGYVLLILPPFFLLLGVAMSAIASRGRGAVGRAKAKAGELLGRRYAVTAAVILLAAGNVATFLIVPQVLQRLERPGRPASGAAEQLMGVLPVHWLISNLESAGIGGNPRQFNVAMSDHYWQALIDFVRQYEPERTVVLASPTGRGSFRHLTYYVPRYHVYALGWDLHGDFGHLFTAYGGTSDYAVSGLKKAGHRLPLPSEVAWILIPDRQIQRRLGHIPRTEVTLESGLRVALVPVPSGATLLVQSANEGGVSLLVSTASRDN